MGNRPNLKLELTMTDNVFEVAGWLCLAFLWGLAITVYSKLPEIIPTHFDLSGQPNEHGSKMGIMFLPVLATLLFIGLTVLNFYPHIFNYPARITADNAAWQYRNATRMIRTLKMIIAFVFSLVVFLMYKSASGKLGFNSYWFMALVLGAIIIPLGYFVLRAVRGR